MKVPAKATKREGAIGSLDQFQLLLYATKDSRLSAADLATLAEITDRFLKRRGEFSRASLTHLERETGRNRSTVRASLRRLEELNYILTVRPGSGTRGTEYEPNFDWTRHTAQAVRAEIDRRDKAKPQKARGGVRTTSTGTRLEVVSTPTLDDEGVAPTPPLRSLVCAPTPPHTYGEPAEQVPTEVSPTWALRLSPAPSEPEQVTVTNARVEKEDGETWLSIELESDAGIETRCITIESTDSDDQTEGQRELSAFTHAIGLPVRDESDLPNLIGRKLVVMGDEWMAMVESESC